MSRQISPQTTLDNLKKEAKRWLKALHANDADARARLRRGLPDAPAAPTLRDVQLALAREHGMSGWTELKQRLAQEPMIHRYQRVAEALVTAYHTPDEAAIRIVWDHFGHMRPYEGMRRYIRLDLGRAEEPSASEPDTITLADARYLVARGQGFTSWQALEASMASVPPGKTIAAKTVGLHTLADPEAPVVRSRDWDEVIAALAERQLPGLHASGQMTDALLERISRLDHIESLNLGGSKKLTDDGLRSLARLPRLAHLNLSACAITDRGLEVLRALRALETIELNWTPITDAGAAHLAACQHLKNVDLTGTPSGDGAIRSLAGKTKLHAFRSGNGVTDAGLSHLHDLPVFKTWQGGEPRMALLSPDARPNYLMLRGPFTNDGMRQLAGLDGLFALNVNPHGQPLAITGAGLAPLAALPHLEWLAFDAQDNSMPYIAALPHLRFLMCQDTTAGDEGFVALSQSRTIEHIWGRRCHNLQRRGFVALAEMPALRYLSVSCQNVDDEGLSALPRFPVLRELMPMDVPDAGYRHIGQCGQLESLVLMYCRETGDEATTHIAGLSLLKKYFASYNRVTDRTPEILSGMRSLEHVTFDSCAGLTNAGIVALARLPRLRELSMGGMPRVTEEVVAAFPPHVRVKYEP